MGGRVATERLIRAGRTRIGLINGQQGLDASRDRLKGYRQALASNDIAFDPGTGASWQLGAVVRLRDDARSDGA